jgi:hypothetical protein
MVSFLLITFTPKILIRDEFFFNVTGEHLFNSFFRECFNPHKGHRISCGESLDPICQFWDLDHKP